MDLIRYESDILDRLSAAVLRLLELVGDVGYAVVDVQ